VSVCQFCVSEFDLSTREESVRIFVYLSFVRSYLQCLVEVRAPAAQHRFVREHGRDDGDTERETLYSLWSSNDIVAASVKNGVKSYVNTRKGKK